MTTDKTSAKLWPTLSYEQFKPTRYLLHMMLQVVGKLKLSKPFHAQWAEVPLWPTARGLTTGPIPYREGAYEVRADFITHEIHWLTSSGTSGKMALGPMSVATFADRFMAQLRSDGIDTEISLMPQEIPDPVPFNEDTQERPYDREQAHAFWRILLSVQRVMQQFQGRFTGKTQPVGLMWGTFDIRLALYNGKPATPASDAGFIRRNAMNAELMEMGWWAGDDAYPQPAFYAFTWPQPAGIENARIAPAAARWGAKQGEFLFDYDSLRQSATPDQDLLAFFESTYAAGATTAKWDPALLGSGRPV